MIYLTVRLGIFTFKTARKQWQGNHSFMETVLTDDLYYFDLHRDINDRKSVNFRYSDHVNEGKQMSHFNLDFLKPEADYYKGVKEHFKRAANC